MIMTPVIPNQYQMSLVARGTALPTGNDLLGENGTVLVEDMDDMFKIFTKAY